MKALTDAELYIQDQLFATLDTTVRSFEMPSGQKVLISDTVGFIRKLPHQLVASFRSTLAETLEADVLLHVVDATHPFALEQIEAVEDTLAQLEVEGLPMITALNKVDGLPAGSDPVTDLGVKQPVVAVSAHTGEGIEQLLLAIEAITEKVMAPLRVTLPYSRGDLVAMFHERGLVEVVSHSEDGTHLEGRVPRRLVPYFADFAIE